jgi:hypothetical protein
MDRFGKAFSALVICLSFLGTGAVVAFSSPIPGADLVKITHSKGKGYVLLDQSELFLSGDGIKWQSAGLGKSKGGIFTAVCAGTDFVLVAESSGTIYRLESGKIETLPAPTDHHGSKIAGLTMMAASPSGREVFASSGIGLVMSKDAGSTWTAMTDPFYKVSDAREVLGVGFAGETLVVATRKGVWKRGRSGFESFNQGLFSPTRPILMAAERGRVMVGFEAQTMVETTDGKTWVRVGLPAESPVAFMGWSGSGYLTEGPFSFIYEGTASGGWKRIGGFSTAFVPVSSLSTPAGTLIALRGKGLYLAGKGNLVPVELPAELATVNARLELGGKVICGTQGGIYLRESGSATWKDVTPESLGGSVSSLLQAPDGRLFAGVWGAGVFVSTDGGSSWSDWNENLGTANTISTLILAGNTILAGTENGVMGRGIDNDLWTLRLGSPREMITNLILAGGSVWAAGDDGLITAPPDGTFTRVPGLAGKVFSLAGEGDRIFAVTGGRVISREPSGKWNALAPLEGPTVVAVSAGRIWAGSSAGGVYLLRDGAWVRQGDRREPVVRLEAAAGGVEVLTRRGGHYRLDSSGR